MTEQDTIYLDNNATTALAPECVEPVLDCLRNSYGNPSSKHAVGERAKAQLAQARAAVVTEELEYTPPSFYVNQYARKKYVKQNGE